MSFQLELTLRSETCFAGGGGGRSGDVDTDLDLDPVTGFPVVRGRILKGLLLEEAANVLRALDRKALWAAAARLFGTPGQSREGALAFGDAHLAEDLESEAWAGLDRDSPHWTAGEVLDALTVVRAQTRVREDGVPDPGSLRRTRLLRSGWIFRAPVSSLGTLSPAEKALVAACAASLGRAGLHRNHGWGEVCLRIIADGTDATAGWLSLLGSDALGSESSPVAPRAEPPESAGGTAAGGSRCVVTYRLILRRPVVLADVGGDTSTVKTHAHLSGGSVLGAAATRWLDDHASMTPDENAFRRLFLDGSTRWLHAYPSNGGARFLPCPETFKVRKDDLATNQRHARICDHALLREGEGQDAQWMAPKSAGFISLSEDTVLTLDVRKTLRLHHVREREKGRPTSAGLFSYEAIEAEQEFTGHVLCESLAIAAQVADLLSAGPLRLGRSRTATYGGEAVVQDVTTTADASKWREAGPEGSRSDGAPLVITLLSDALARTAGGTPDPLAAVVEIQATLGLGAPTRQFLASRRVAGYVGVWRMPRAVHPALAAGSVLVFDGSAVDEKQVETILWQGIGERRAEGFGRVAIQWQRSSELTPVPVEFQRARLPVTQAVSPQREMFRRRLAETVLADAVIRLAQNDAANVRGSLSPSLLSRLRSRVRTASGREELRVFLGRLEGKMAGKALQAVQFRNKSFAESLLNQEWREYRTTKVALERLEKGMGLDPLRAIGEEQRWPLTQVYLDALLEKLRRREPSRSAR